MNQVGLADALFGKTQQRVLGVLFPHPERSFYSNEIVRLAGVGIGSVQRELFKLHSAGILTVTQLGNQKHYQANPACPIFTEICGIVLKTTGLADQLKRVLQPFDEQIHLAFIYGSIAKGSASSESDIDLMLIASGLSYSELMEVLGDAEVALGRPINPTIYTPNELQLKLDDKNSFIIRVMEQDKIFLKGSMDDIKKSLQN